MQSCGIQDFSVITKSLIVGFFTFNGLGYMDYKTRNLEQTFGNISMIRWEVRHNRCLNRDQYLYTVLQYLIVKTQTLL